MSPRSEEFIATARDRLRAAEAALSAGFASVAVSAAYYAALYAARAALSEHDRHAETHTGAWSGFSELFVIPGRFDAGLFASARRIQEIREAGDYDAREIAAHDARLIVEDATRFVAAVAEMLGA